MPNAAQYEDKLEAYTEGKDPHAMQVLTLQGFLRS